jgi:hypothetical protein
MFQIESKASCQWQEASVYFASGGWQLATGLKFLLVE